jgi:protein TonB
MSLSPALGDISPTLGKLHPRWLRPAAVALVVAAHIGVLAFGRARIDAPPSLESMEVSLVPLGDSVADQIAQAEAKPEQAQEPLPEPPPPAPELAAPPPEQAAPEAPPLPVAEPKPEPKPARLKEAERDKRIQERRQEERRQEERKAQEARQAARRGAAGGSSHASVMSAANFAGLVVAQLNRHKFYPAAARAAGVTGTVGVVFTIGPSGRVVSQSVTRSSGYDVLDSAARTIMSAIHTPPPPGGHFSTSTNINFHTR